MARLTVTGLTKTFGAVTALAGVELSLRDGEVLGLVGENGAGKSTLLNVLSGVLRPESGEIRLDGKSIALGSYQAANRLGIFRVFQEPAFVGTLTVYESVFFGWEALFRTRLGLLDREGLRAATRGALEQARLDRLSPWQRVRDLTPGARQSLDIARVVALAERLDVERPIVLFDEPTTALDREHEENFLHLLEDLRGYASVVFVSHRLAEVLRSTSRIVVLKDGRNAGELPTSEASEPELHRLMVGRLRAANYYHETAQIDAVPRPSTTPRLRLECVSTAPMLQQATLDVLPGEVVGIAGTEDCGKRELGEAIAGIRPLSGGRVSVDGRAVGQGIPAAIKAGIAYVPPDRQHAGLVSGLSIAKNIQLASLHDRFATRVGGFWRRRAARQAAARYMGELSIAAPTIDAPASSLSGGNQQKVLLAKWLLRSPRVLVLDAPTQGVDTGAREGIYALIRDIAQNGTSVVVISDDLSEIIGLSTRVAVVTDGRIVSLMDAPAAAKPSEQALVTHMLPLDPSTQPKNGATAHVH